jgi:hypothetical protein
MFNSEQDLASQKNRVTVQAARNFVVKYSEH